MVLPGPCRKLAGWETNLGVDAVGGHMGLNAEDPPGRVFCSGPTQQEARWRAKWSLEGEEKDGGQQGGQFSTKNRAISGGNAS